MTQSGGRYSRNIALAPIGQSGQDALQDSHVCVVGAGGLGSVVLQYLAAIGIGHISIIESDRVEASNLPRQHLYTHADIGKPKIECALARLKEMAPDCEITTHPCRLDEYNWQKVIDANTVDVLVDCSDNFETRFLLNRISLERKTPLVAGAAIEFEGYVSTFKGYEKEKPCFQCFCPQIPSETVRPNCSTNGVFPPLIGVIGSLQAGEVVKQILALTPNLEGVIQFCNAKTGRFRSSVLKKDQCCKCC